MASESCSTSSSSSGGDFVPIFFLLSQSHEVIPQNLRQEAEYNTVDERDAAAAAAETQFDENESDRIEWGRHSGVSVESALCRDRRQARP